jgi:hypothetical protein
VNFTTKPRGAPDFAVRLFPMPWSVVASSGISYITSDSGIGVIDGWRGDLPQVNVLGSRDARLLMPMSRAHCLQIGPEGYAPNTIAQAKLESRDVMLVNLAVYGWAQRHIFAEGQRAAQDVRRAAKKSPQAAGRPQPFKQHILIERDPLEDSLAQAHRRVGRSPYIEHAGETFDYVVLRDDNNLAADALRALALGKARAARRTGTTDLRSGNEIISPMDVRRVDGGR